MAGRTRKSADDRRDEILDKAVEAFATAGFQDTSFQKIADAVGVSQSAVLHHFRTKEALLEAAIRRIVLHNHTLVTGALRPEDDALVRLRKHFRGNLDWSVRYRQEAQMVLLLYAMAGHSPGLAAFYREVVQAGRARVTELVHGAIRERFFRKSLDAEETGILLHDMLVGGIIAAICVPAGPAELRRTQERWDQAFAAFSGSAGR